MNEHLVSRRDFLSVAAVAAGTAAPSISGAVEDEAVALSFRRELPVHKPYDVIVCGGGPSGTAAAVTAARAGAKVLLVEGQGQLGGMGVSGMVSEWLGGDNGGLFHEFATEAIERGIARLSNWGPAFDPFAMAHYLDEKVAEAGVDVLLLTQAVDVRVEDGRITHIVTFNKSGLAAVPTRAVIDATGDADIAARSGCNIVKGRESDGLMTPTTLIFHVDNVDEKALNAHFQEFGDRLLGQIEELQEAGEWPFPYNRFITRKLNEDGVWMVNTVRLVGIDGTNGRSKSEGMVRGREEVQQLMEIFRKHVPGYGEARIKAVAPLLGVRETRRIVGRYVLTAEDLAAGMEFDDVIGYSTWGSDIPDPKRPSVNPDRLRIRGGKPIPYRIMVPQPIENLICPGRAVSTDRIVLGSIRVMSPCMAMGQAAGRAAVQVVQDNVSFAQVDTRTLREQLTAAGVRI
jgi:glycine/D-amino acid oxidase-like deaminating enzyme